MGVPYFYVLALIAGIGELIPIVGPLLAAIPAVAVAFSVSPATRAGRGGLLLPAAAGRESRPRAQGHVAAGRHQPGLVIMALLIGGSLLGLVGAILAVPTAAILQVLLQELLVEATAD